MQIKKISLYSVPYTEDDHFQPFKSKLPQDWIPLKEFSGISAALEKFGREIILTATYDEIRNANYIKFELLINGKDEDYYAWIEKITIGSQINKGRMIIYYHWDYWRTFIEKITPLRGIIVQRKELENNPPQIVPKIIEIYSKTVHDIINQDKEIVWIYISYVDPNRDTKAGIQRITFPVHRNFYEKRFQLNDAIDGTFIDAPSFREVINGSLLIWLGLEEKKIIGCSVSSIAPINYRRNGDQLTIPYSSTELKSSVSIYTNDLIQSYGQSLQAYDNVHEYWINDFELTSRMLVELKWWCFPREKITFGYDPYEKTRQITLIPAEVQYYPFLQQLKYYSPYYEEIKKLIFNEGESKYLVVYASYHWDMIDVHKNIYKQIFDNFFESPIKEITKIPNKEDKFNILCENGKTIPDAGIENIFVLRLKENEPFTFTLVTEDSASITSKKIDNRLLVISNVDGVWPLQFHAFEKPLKSIPLNNLYLLDNYGYPVNKFEQEREILNYTVQAVSQNNQMFILFKFNKGSYIDNTEFLINMTPIDVAQEYFNEYILTVEREAANQRRVDNIISSLSNLAAGAVMGTLIGGPTGGIINTTSSIAKTIGAGVVTAGLVGGGLSFYQQARLEERLKQRGSLLIRGGNDYSWLSNGYLMSLVITKIDDYSKNLYIKKVKMFGIDCNEIDDDGHIIAKLLSEEGPLKLSSLTLDKDIPYEANVYIREKLFNGVLLDSNLSQPSN